MFLRMRRVMVDQGQFLIALAAPEEHTRRRLSLLHRYNGGERAFVAETDKDFWLVPCMANELRYQPLSRILKSYHFEPCWFTTPPVVRGQVATLQEWFYQDLLPDLLPEQRWLPVEVEPIDAWDSYFITARPREEIWEESVTEAYYLRIDYQTQSVTLSIPYTGYCLGQISISGPDGIRWWLSNLDLLIAQAMLHGYQEAPYP